MTLSATMRHAGSVLAIAAVAGLGSAAPAQETGTTYTTPAGFEEMVADKLPSVVGILSTVPAQPMQQGGPQLPPGLEDFFGAPRPGPEGAPMPARAQGSGFVVSGDGYVVTNNHVVERAEEVEVKLDDGSIHAAEIVGTDPATDIALLKIDADISPDPVAWGASQDLQIGEWVVAIGNPLGLSGTVTTGILSAKARDIQAGPYDNFLQTDAAINRGNSGGPLFNTEGEVVGVNTAIFSPSGGSIGIGFAVPSSVAQSVVADLRDDGVVDRGYLGVRVQPVDEDLADALGLVGDARGALVSQVTDGAPAAEAGIEPGDVILSVAGEAIETPRDLTFTIAALAAGQSVPVTLLRDGEEQEIDVTIGDQPADLFGASVPAPAAPESEDFDGPRIGVSVSPLDEQTRAQTDIPETVFGLLIAQVEPGSAADAAGLRPGDVIAEVSGDAVASVSDLRDAVSEAADGDDPVLMRIWRDGGYSFVTLRLSDAAGASEG